MASINSLTALCLLAGTKNSDPTAFSHRNQYKKDKKHKHNYNHNHPHHDKLLAPPVMWILYLLPVQCKHNVDEGLGEGVVKAI